MGVWSVITALLIVLFFAVAFYKTAKPFLRYKRAGKVTEYSGEVAGKVSEETRKFGGQMVTIAYPQYSVVINGKRRLVQGTVAYPEVVVGEAVKVLHCADTGEIWAARDIPLMGKQLRIRILVLGAIAAVIIVSAIGFGA